MPKYTVTIASRWTEYADVTIDAETPEQAEALALQADPADWYGMTSDDRDVIDIEEADEDEDEDDETREDRASAR